MVASAKIHALRNEKLKIFRANLKESGYGYGPVSSARKRADEEGLCCLAVLGVFDSPLCVAAPSTTARSHPHFDNRIYHLEMGGMSEVVSHTKRCKRAGVAWVTTLPFYSAYEEPRPRRMRTSFVEVDVRREYEFLKRRRTEWDIIAVKNEGLVFRIRKPLVATEFALISEFPCQLLTD